MEDKHGNVLAAVAAVIPNTVTARNKMTNWLKAVSPLGKGATEMTNYKPPLMKTFGEPGGGGGYCEFAMCGTMDPLVVTGEAPNREPWNKGGWGAWAPWPDNLLNAPVNFSDAPAGGGGGGNGGNGNNAGSIAMGIELAKLPELKCVARKVLGTKNMQNLISAFRFTDKKIVLIFSGKKKLINEEGDPVLGGLDLKENFNTGQMMYLLYANATLAGERSAVETAITYYHEAIHAEMRRYLKENADESTLPNFPESFTETWKRYMKVAKNDERAHQSLEHIMMAKSYINQIAYAAKQFDNSQLPFKYYKALAWIGLTPDATSIWYDKYTSQEIKEIRNNIDRAQQALRNRSNPICGN